MISEELSTQEQREWAKAVGITIPDFSRNGNTEEEAEKVNRPMLVNGLTPIIFNDDGTTEKVEKTDSRWYAYIDQGIYKTDGKTSRWANAESQDGSQWVWIPRYAYKINYTNPSNKSIASEIDVVFIDIDNKDELGNDYTNGYDGYIVHPAFTSNVEQGGWDSELAGIWIAKYEAGFSGVNKIASNGESSIIYSVSTKNAVGTIQANITKMTYPVFKPNAYSYNLVTIGDAYTLSMALTESNNPYGFIEKANSHMLKNSEWGAASYLTQSKYGRNGIQVTINNGTSPAYAVTGCSSQISYRYNTEKGMLASTTGNMYGIYDMSGGTYEFTAGYVNNGQSNLLNFGKKIVDKNNDGIIDSVSSKLVSVYNVGTADSVANNYTKNSLRKGEAIWETSSYYSGTSSWFQDYSNFPYSNTQFFCRGGYCADGIGAGLFNFGRMGGSIASSTSFRVVLCFDEN